jgi:hypothetical protein
MVQETGWALGPGWTRAENLAPTGIRSPDRPSRSESFYRLSYPAHNSLLVFSTQPTNPKEQSPSWEAYSSSANQEILRILLDPVLYRRIYMSPPRDPTLSHTTPVHALFIYHEDPFSYYTPSIPGSSKLTLYIMSPHQNPPRTSPLLHTCYEPWPNHSSCSDHPESISARSF